MNDKFRKQIVDVFNEVYKMQLNTENVPDLTEETVLLETGLDSLGFAILVVQLEEELGFDPFVLSAVANYPRTFGDFVRFYVANEPR